jgi:hypothetical protein
MTSKSGQATEGNKQKAHGSGSRARMHKAQTKYLLTAIGTCSLMSSACERLMYNEVPTCTWLSEAYRSHLLSGRKAPSDLWKNKVLLPFPSSLVAPPNQQVQRRTWPTLFTRYLLPFAVLVADIEKKKEQGDGGTSTGRR